MDDRAVVIVAREEVGDVAAFEDDARAGPVGPHALGQRLAAGDAELQAAAGEERQVVLAAFGGGELGVAGDGVVEAVEEVDAAGGGTHHPAAEGDALIAPNVTRRLLATFAGQAPAASSQPVDPLTEREEQVLLTLARGRTNAEIAAELHISLSTVKTHIGSLMTKLGARNRVEVAMWGYETGRLRD